MYTNVPVLLLKLQGEQQSSVVIANCTVISRIHFNVPVLLLMARK